MRGRAKEIVVMFELGGPFLGQRRKSKFASFTRQHRGGAEYIYFKKVLYIQEWFEK